MFIREYIILTYLRARSFAWDTWQLNDNFLSKMTPKYFSLLDQSTPDELNLNFFGGRNLFDEFCKEDSFSLVVVDIDFPFLEIRYSFFDGLFQVGGNRSWFFMAF